MIGEDINMNKKFYKCIMLIIILLSLVIGSYCQNPPTLQELKRAGNAELSGAKVSNVNEAARIAQKEYIERTRNFTASEGMGHAIIVELGFVVKDFAQIGDKVWEVRLTNMNSDGQRALRAILWVHSDTGQVHIVCGQ